MSLADGSKSTFFKRRKLCGVSARSLWAATGEQRPRHDFRWQRELVQGLGQDLGSRRRQRRSSAQLAKGSERLGEARLVFDKAPNHRSPGPRAPPRRALPCRPSAQAKKSPKHTHTLSLCSLCSLTLQRERKSSRHGDGGLLERVLRAGQTGRDLQPQPSALLGLTQAPTPYIAHHTFFWCVSLRFLSDHLRKTARSVTSLRAPAASRHAKKDFRCSSPRQPKETAALACFMCLRQLTKRKLALRMS